MSVTVGSLHGNDQRLLEDLDLLPDSSEEEETDAEAGPAEEQMTVTPSVQTRSSTAVAPSSTTEPRISRTYRQGTADGIPWFEEMIEGSRLGRLMKTRRGIGMSDDQSTRIEWEVSEWTNDGTGEVRSASSVHAPGKRKRGYHTSMEDL